MPFGASRTRRFARPAAFRAAPSNRPPRNTRASSGAGPFSSFRPRASSLNRPESASAAARGLPAGVARTFPPGGFGPVLDGGVGAEGALAPAKVPTGRAVREAVCGDEADRPLLDPGGVRAAGQSQAGKVAGAATTPAAAGAGEGNDRIDGALGPRGPRRSWGVRVPAA